MTVDELLDGHVAYVRTLESAAAELVQIRRLKKFFGPRRLSTLVKSDFERFRDSCVAEGLSIATVSRSLSTFRSAANRAVDNRELKSEHMPKVPEFRKKVHILSAPPKGRVLTVDEIARFIDAIDELHLLVFSVHLLNTAARTGAILDLTASQIDLANETINLNPMGRLQTNKWRTTLPLTETLRPWVTGLPPGQFVAWQGGPVHDINNAFRTACKRAGLPGGEAPYSIRHAADKHGTSRLDDTAPNRTAG
jgi:integrase